MKEINPHFLAKTLDARLADNLAANQISGAQLIVRQNGKTVYRNSVGCQDPLTGEPIKENAMFRLASMTKPVTAVAALIAFQKGWFQPDDLLAFHLPCYTDLKVARMENGQAVIDHNAHQPLRIWHLLSHCNGIMAECPLGNIIFEQTPHSAFSSIAASVDYCAHQPLAFDPAEYTAYSGYAAFDIVARMIELKSGCSFENFLKQSIFDPLGLTDLTFHPTQEQWSRMIAMSDQASGRGMVRVDMGKHLFESFPLSYTCAGAGLAGTLYDYSIFAEMLLEKGSYEGIRIIDPAVFDELTKPRVPLDMPGRDPVSSWGLGVRVVDQQEILPVGSFGWSGAYGTHFWVDPENRITAVYLRNSRWYDSHGCGNIGKQFEKDVMSSLIDHSYVSLS